MENQITKKNAPDWKLGLAYFGYVFIGILPLNAFVNILSLYGNNTYKLILAGLYIIVLPFWIQRTVMTATALFIRRYNFTRKLPLIIYTSIYFIAIWLLILFKLNQGNYGIILFAGLLELYLIGWLIWFSLKYLRIECSRQGVKSELLTY